MSNQDQQIIMKVKGKTANSTTLIIERQKVQNTNDKMHVAGGEHTGLIISKETCTGNPNLNLNPTRLKRVFYRKWGS